MGWIDGIARGVAAAHRQLAVSAPTTAALLLDLGVVNAAERAQVRQNVVGCRVGNVGPGVDVIDVEPSHAMIVRATRYRAAVMIAIQRFPPQVLPEYRSVERVGHIAMIQTASGALPVVRRVLMLGSAKVV